MRSSANGSLRHGYDGLGLSSPSPSASGDGGARNCVRAAVADLSAARGFRHRARAFSSGIDRRRRRPDYDHLSTPNSNDCRRYQLNVDTGARDEQGAISCSGDGSKQPGRLEAISKAFRNR